jgi:Lhr-like helicase
MAIEINLPKILSNLNIKALNDMQADVLHSVELEKELLVLSNTGSGKTLAFLLSVLQKLLCHHAN